MHSLVRSEAYREREANQLRQVLLQLTTSLEGSISHRRYEQELSERIRYAHELDVSHARYRDLYEHVYDAILMVDDQGEVVSLNKAARNLLAVEESSPSSGLHFLDLFSLRPDVKPQERFATLQREGVLSRVRCTLQRRDGQEVEVELSATAIIKAGTYAGARVQLRDITDELAAEQRQAQLLLQLQENEARTRTILESALDGVIIVNEEGLIEEWNAMAQEIFGWARAEILGKSLAETIIPPHFREAHGKGMRRYHQTGVSRVLNQRIEIEGLHQSGRVFPIELSIVPVHLDKRTFFSAFVRDITQQKAEMARREALLSELAQANEELKDFAYIVSHDLKAPLRAISSLAHWIEDDYAEHFDDGGKEQMRLLQGRVQRMQDLIDGILEYSRVGRVNLQPESVPLTALLAEVLEALDVPAHIEVIVPPDLPTLEMNRTSLYQIFQNLIFNAIRYMDKPAGRVELGWKPDDAQTGYGQFWVKDNGPGIDPRFHERIFRIFQTLQPRDKLEATGVGLSIVRKLVHLHQGRIWVESQTHQGSTFFLTLPLQGVPIHSQSRS
ncbi:MAG: PAS domain S-box protein [Bacteroidetes bacterium]|nr:MAG: PAS domain S-box protein [Bacteroidota bacterium]